MGYKLYLNFKALVSSVDQTSRDKRLLTYNIWDGAHLMELAISKDCIAKNKLMKETMNTVAGVIVLIGHGMLSFYVFLGV